MKAPITPSEWAAMLSLDTYRMPRTKYTLKVEQRVLDRLVEKGLAMRDQAAHLPNKPYRYWLSKRGINVRLLLKGLV